MSFSGSDADSVVEDLKVSWKKDLSFEMVDGCLGISSSLFNLTLKGLNFYSSVYVVFFAYWVGLLF